MGVPVMEPISAVAASLEALASWIDDALAGGRPAKWVAQQASAAARHIAADTRHNPEESMTMDLRTAAYKTLKASNDVRAVKRGRVPRRIARRAFGRVSGRVARKWFG